MGKSIGSRLRAGEILKGAVINIVHPTLIEVVTTAGADFLFIDFEHGLRGYNEIAHALVAADLHATPALIRVGERSANLVARMLDGGAAGFLFPHVESADEAAELVSWCRYQPAGIRGSGFARASLGYAGNEFDRRKEANHDVACIMIVESLKGRTNLEQILQVEGVTGIALGPGDLSMELGVSDWRDPKVTAILDEMSQMVRSYPGRALLRLAIVAEDAGALAAGGANMILLNHDVTLIGQMYSEMFTAIEANLG